MSDDNQVLNYVTRNDKEIQCCFCGITFSVKYKKIWQHLTNEHNVIRELTYIKLNKKSLINKKDKVDKKSQVGTNSGKKEKQKRILVWEYFTKCPNEPDRALCNICKISLSTKSYSASSCTSSFFSHLEVKHAILVGKTKKGRQQCSYCGKKFYFPKKITNFRKNDCEEMHGRKGFPCTYDGCPQKFHISSALRRHISAVHKKEKTNICDKCGRAFNLPTQLKTHSRIHTGEYPFECAKCHKKFRFASTRHNHKCVTT